MSWIERFEEDIAALHQLRTGWLGGEAARLIAEARTLFTPQLEDHFLDPGDLDVIADNWWSRFRIMEVDLAKKECAIASRLAPLYERLQRASDAEWETYSRIIVRARFAGEHPLLRTLWESMPEVTR